MQGRNSGWPVMSRPALLMWKPSTSFSAAMASITLCASMCLGSGSCTRMPWMDGSRLSASMRSSNWASVRSAGYCSLTECRPAFSQAATLLRT
ncbi:Uncharacterised protein [Bordetella pertussis]|nr:Uncharacterised protein [Bordetella pertussis]CFP64996.1 Uncharacterised protein [Bordetella pertussis]CFW34054.1 Uncharacterised protein [Bordetella pertussis]CPN94141.1 Uncharacterised protein [Bordetella pertussis]